MYYIVKYIKWHDPSRFTSKPVMTEEYYNELKSMPPWKVQRDDLAKYECLGIVKADEIEWFHRPW